MAASETMVGTVVDRVFKYYECITSSFVVDLYSRVQSLKRSKLQQKYNVNVFMVLH